VCVRRYVSGRVRAPGEINGKSGNLNHCLQHVIYPAQAPACLTAAAAVAAATTPSAGGSVQEAAAATAAIPVTDLVVVFDADMVCKPSFFRHVSVEQPPVACLLAQHQSPARVALRRATQCRLLALHRRQLGLGHVTHTHAVMTPAPNTLCGRCWR
jgi:hypothetical protein